MRELRASVNKKQSQITQVQVQQVLKKKRVVDLNKTLTGDLKVRTVYKTDGKQSIYQQLETDQSLFGSGGFSNFKGTSRSEKRKSFLTADGCHRLTKIKFKAEQSPRRNVQKANHNMEEIFDQCREKIMEDLEQKILDKNERVRLKEEAIQLEFENQR